MPGRAGRSKGCLTCRERHLKCDEAKPTCQRCRAKGIECGGYRGATFIDETQRFLVRRKSGPQPISLSVASPPLRSSNNIDSGSFLRDQRLVPIIKAIPSLSPWRDDIVLSHLRYGLARPDPATTQELFPGFDFVMSDSPLALRCLNAMATAYFGKTHYHPKSSHEGWREYGNSLRELGIALSDPLRQKSDDTLISVLILESFEMMFVSTPTAWTLHSAGISFLLQTRGPHAFRHGVPHYVFENTRFTVAIVAAMSSQVSFLHSPEWRTIPWIDKTKDARQLFNDILLDLGYAKAFIARSSPSVNAKRREIFSVLDKMLQWRRAWDQQPGTSMQQAPLCPGMPASFGTALVAQSFYAAECFATYCGALVHCATIARMTYLEVHEPYDDRMLAALDAAHVAAVDACRATPHQAAGRYAVFWQLVLMHPLRFAWQAFGGGATREGRWVEATLRKMAADERGWGVAEHVLDQSMQLRCQEPMNRTVVVVEEEKDAGKA